MYFKNLLLWDQILSLKSKSPFWKGSLTRDAYRMSHMLFPIKKAEDTVCSYTVELLWLKRAWDHENWFQSKIVLASKVKVQYL